MKQYIESKNAKKTDYRLLSQDKAEKEAIEVEKQTDSTKPTPLEYNEIVSFFIKSYGIDKSHILGGSIEEKHCHRIVYAIQKQFNNKRIIGLNVGNFLGVAFSFILSRIVQNNDETTMVSVDPNIPHRGIVDLEDKFVACLDAFNLHRNSMVINGYSLNKNVSNDGVTFDNYNPNTSFDNEKGCTGVLQKLSKIGHKNFHFILLDGNHHSDYLTQEMELCSQLLDTGGLLFLDDINENWKLLRQSAFAFIEKDSSEFEELYYDGRILALKKK